MRKVAVSGGMRVGTESSEVDATTGSTIGSRLLRDAVTGRHARTHHPTQTHHAHARAEFPPCSSMPHPRMLLLKTRNPDALIPSSFTGSCAHALKHTTTSAIIRCLYSHGLVA